MKTGLSARLLSLLAFALLAVSACGQMGPLFLPQDMPIDGNQQDQQDDEDDER